MRIARTLDEAQEAVKELEVFRLRDGKSLRGLTEAPSWLGYLPAEFSEDIALAEYVVMSYDTPIAWVIDGEKFIPDVGYSLTTGQHQYLVKAAWFRDWSFPRRGRLVVPAGTGRRSGGWDDDR